MSSADPITQLLAFFCKMAVTRGYKCCWHPFFIIWVLLLFIGVLPFAFMLVAISTSKTYECEFPFTKTALYTLGISNFVNFFACQIIICSKSNKRSIKKPSDPVCCRMITHYCNNFFYVIYFAVYIFFLVWAIISHNQYATESPYSACYSQTKYFKGAFLFNIICMDLFVIGTFITFIISYFLASKDTPVEKEQVSPPTGLEPEAILNQRSAATNPTQCIGSWKSCLQRFSMGFGMFIGGQIPKNPYDLEDEPKQTQAEIIGAAQAQTHQQQQLTFMIQNQQQQQHQQMQANMNGNYQMQQFSQQQNQFNQNQMMMPQMYPIQKEQQQLQQHPQFVQTSYNLDNSANQSMINATYSKNSAPLIFPNAGFDNSNHIANPHSDQHQFIGGFSGAL